MARQINHKELVNTRLAANYGGWMYCNVCNENIGYLCYATYDRIDMTYECQCGSKGSVCIDFSDSQAGACCDEPLVKIKNRWCCSADQEPLITILEPKLRRYHVAITCKACSRIYKQSRE
ncbi:MAG: hypothetical protein HFE77_04745 [Clostridiales bacterium]|nr:hypothetical protein [Clostridiales bacterium]